MVASRSLHWTIIFWRRYGILTLAILGLALGLAFAWYSINGPNKWRVIAAIPRPIRSVGEFFVREIKDLPYLSYRFGRHGLPEYDIRLAEKDLEFLNKNLPPLGGILTEEYEQYVPARLIYEGQEYKVQVRYRGLTSGHWAFPKKSWRVRFDKQNLRDGKRSLHLIIPLDRAMVGEELNHWRARRLGLLVPDSRFVVVRVNGRRPALYWEAEHMDQGFLERHGAVGDANLYGDAYGFKPLYTDVAYWRKYVANPRQPLDDYTELAALLNLLNNAPDDVFYRDIFNILDKENFYAWSLWQILAKSSGQSALHNMRLYFDPSVGKFKILAWDLGVGQQSYRGTEPIVEESENPLLIRILRHPQFMAERNERLWAYLRNEDNLRAELSYANELFAQIRRAYYQDRIKEEYNADVEKEVARVKQVISDQFAYLKSQFESFAGSCRLREPSPGQRLLEIQAGSLAPIRVAGVDIKRTLPPSLEAQVLPTGYEPPDIQEFTVFRVKEAVLSVPLPTAPAEAQLTLNLSNEYTGETRVIACVQSL